MQCSLTVIFLYKDNFELEKNITLHLNLAEIHAHKLLGIDLQMLTVLSLKKPKACQMFYFLTDNKFG